jgi:hypothetical protein
MKRAFKLEAGSDYSFSMKDFQACFMSYEGQNLKSWSLNLWILPGSPFWPCLEHRDVGKDIPSSSYMIKGIRALIVSASLTFFSQV